MKQDGPILGWDTETFNGAVKLLALSDGRFIEPTSTNYTDDCFDLLYTAAKYARWMVAWNLGFDFTAICKPWVVEHADTLRAEHYANIKRTKRLRELGLKAETDESGLSAEELRETQALHAELDGSENIERFNTTRYHVVLIGSKGFSLTPRTEEGGRRFKKGREWFFDSAAWFSSSYGGVSLDYASRKFLHEGKTNEDLGISRERIGSEAGYYEAHRDAILSYCVQDCNLTARLMALAVKGFEELGYPFPEHPFSRASVSREYLKTSHRLDATAKEYDRLAMSPYSNLWVKSFRGGVFVQLGAGRWVNPYALDINSAYPDAMVNFPSLEGAVPVERSDPRFAGCFFKFYRIELDPTPRTPTRDRGETRKIYGWAFEKVSLCVTGLDLDVLDAMGEPYTIFDAVGIYTPSTERPLAYLSDAFARKSEVKKKYGAGSVQYANLKIFLNGTYGILAQRKPREGQWTNLIYASYVTAWCRKKLWDAVRETEERGDYVVSLATDGLLAVGDGAREYWRMRDSAELGAWTFAPHTEAVCYESGVGFLDTCVRCATEGPDHEGDHTDTVKKRGMPNLTRKALLACNEVTWTETTSRPLKLRSALIQKRTHLLGVFEKHDRTLCAVCSYRDAGMAFPKEVATAPLKDYFSKSWRLRLRGQVGDRLTPPRDPRAAAEWWAALRAHPRERGYIYIRPQRLTSVATSRGKNANHLTEPKRGSVSARSPTVRGSTRSKGKPKRSEELEVILPASEGTPE